MPSVEVPVRSRSRLVVAVLVGLTLLVAACAPGGASPSASATAAPSGSPVGSAASSAPSAERVALKVGLGYIPSVQFAPFYLADQAGYYREAGLDVTFRHGTDYDVIALVAKGEL